MPASHIISSHAAAYRYSLSFLIWLRRTNLSLERLPRPGGEVVKWQQVSKTQAVISPKWLLWQREPQVGLERTSLPDEILVVWVSEEEEDGNGSATQQDLTHRHLSGMFLTLRYLKHSPSIKLKQEMQWKAQVHLKVFTIKKLNTTEFRRNDTQRRCPAGLSGSLVDGCPLGWHHPKLPFS